MSRPNVKAGPRAVRAGQPRTYRTLEPTVTDQPQHTPAEAVQYWYDAATERREERDRLRAVVARIRQMADYWEQQLPEVIRTPAVVSALRAALESTPAVVAPPTNRPTAPTEWVDGHPQLEAIAAAVWEHCQRGGHSTVDDDPRNIAVAALAAVAADQAVVRAETLREGANAIEQHPGPIPWLPGLPHGEGDGFWWDTRDRDAAAALLRRLADEEQQAAAPAAELLALAIILEIPRPGTALPLQLRRSYGHADRWAICDREGRRWHREHGWVYEAEGIRDEALRDATRYTLAEAVPLARRLADPSSPADEEQQPTTAQQLLSSRCDACLHTLNWHRNDVGCTVTLCACGRFQYPAEEAHRD